MTINDRLDIQREAHRQSFDPPPSQPKAAAKARVEGWQDGQYLVSTDGQIQLKSARTTGAIGNGEIVNSGYSIDSMPASRVQSNQKPQLIGAKKKSIFVLGQSWQITDSSFVVDGSGVEGEVSAGGISIGSATRSFQSLINPILTESGITARSVAILYTGSNLYEPIVSAYPAGIVDLYNVASPSQLEAVEIEQYNHVWDFAAMSTSPWQSRIEALHKKNGLFIYQTLWGVLQNSGALGSWTGGLDRDAKVLATITLLYQETLSQISYENKCRGEIANRFGGGTFIALSIGSLLGNFAKGKPICTVLREAVSTPSYAIVDRPPPNTPFLMYK